MVFESRGFWNRESAQKFLILVGTHPEASLHPDCEHIGVRGSFRHGQKVVARDENDEPIWRDFYYIKYVSSTGPITPSCTWGNTGSRIKIS